jgi:hypothetical protein
MDEQTFKRLMNQASIFHRIGDDTGYLAGYMRGLRRAYHGERFGTEDEHTRWLSLAGDPRREAMGRGYRDGLAGHKPAEAV